MKNTSLKITLLGIIILFLPTGVSGASKCLTDQLGRKVIIPASPRRIVALAPSITEILFSLKLARRVVGVTRFSNFPPQATEFPKVGSYVHLDLEKIVALKPDLCIAVKDGNAKAVIDRLDSLKIPVYAVDPRNFKAVIKTLLEIGILMDAVPQATALAQKMHARIERIKSRVGKAKRRPGIFFQIGISPIVSVGTDTFMHELIVLAGGKNLSAGPVPYPRFSIEQVLGLSPEVLIITSMARGEIFERVKAEWNRWADMPAVRNNRIFLVDSDLFDRATPRLIDGLELLARLIHPEIFRDIQ